MAKGTRVCKVCGATYPYCKTHNTNGNFRWQDVACCIEHATQYFKQIEESRKPKNEVNDSELEDVYDNWFEYGDDDDEYDDDDVDDFVE